MSAARKPKAKNSPSPGTVGPKPAADHGQDPAAAGARQHDDTEPQDAETADSGRKRPNQRQDAPTATEQEESQARPTERVSLLLTPDDAKALKMARVEDGIDANKRIRAMINMWREDQRHRARIDKRAKQYRR